MSESTRRNTTRFVAVPDDHPLAALRLPVRYARDGAVFRAVRVEEELYELSDEAGGGERYAVRLAGPVVTSRGRDHAARTGQADYGTWRTPLSELPKQARDLLAGETALAGPLAGLRR